MKLKNFYSGNLHLKISEYENADDQHFKCAQKECNNVPIGYIEFKYLPIQVRFCTDHEKESLDVIEKSGMKPDSLKYFEDFKLPDNIKVLAEKAGLNNIKAYTNDPEKLAGLKIYLESLIKKDKWNKKGEKAPFNNLIFFLIQQHGPVASEARSIT